MISPHAVCYSIIEGCKALGSNVTPLKLIKLVYISHGFHLAFTDKRLIEDDIEAWKYGPVIRCVYEYVKRFGRHSIDIEPFIEYREEFECADQQSKAIINAVVKHYGQKDGLELSTRCHLPESPWDIVQRRNGFSQSGNIVIIPNDLIKNYYKEKIYV